MCPACSAHLRDVEVACPFCAAPRTASKVAVAAATLVSALAISACAYGLPPQTPIRDAAVDAHHADAVTGDAVAADAPPADAH